MFCCRFKYVLWLDATNKATMEQGYKDIAAALGGASEAAVSLHTARASLAALREEWLLIVDGADDADAMSGLWPPGRSGSILYTSRNPTLKDFAADAVCQIAEMDDDEAVQLLLDAARLTLASAEVTALATGIVHELGNLALAIDQAGAYIARGECRVYDFSDTLARHRASLLGVDAYSRASSDKRAVYATWELSYKAIKRKAARKLQRNPLAQVARNALQLLNMLAYFHFEDVTEEIFRRAAEDPEGGSTYPLHVDFRRRLAGDRGLRKNLLPLHSDKRWNPQPFRECTAMLASYSLLSFDKTLGVISMHRLVHQWTFDRLSRDLRLAALQSSTAAIARSIPYTNEVKEYAIQRQLVPHIIAVLQRATINNLDPFNNTRQLDRVSGVLFDNGQYNLVVLLQRRALKWRRKLLGNAHGETLASLGNLALTFRLQGRAAEAEAMHQEELGLKKRVLGPEHPGTLASMGNLALAVGEQGRAGEAEAMHREVLQISQRVLGPEHPDTLTNMDNLATAVREEGRAGETEAMHREVLEIRQRELGPEHPSTLASMGNLACAVSEQGRAGEAEAMHCEVLEIRQRVMGPEHPSTLTSMGNLACAVGEEGRAGEAEAMHREVLEIRQGVLGQEHPDTLACMGSLAKTLRMQGRAAEAEALHREALEVCERVLGLSHPDTLFQLHGRARALRSLGENIDALALMRRCYELLRKNIGDNHPRTLATLDIVNRWQQEDSGGSSSTPH
jgi:hypothetical protein